VAYERVKPKHVPKSGEICLENKVTISWNKHAKTDKTSPNNKPNIIIRDNEKREMSADRY